MRQAGLSLHRSAIVCRATKKKLALRNLGQEYGRGAIRCLTAATIARDSACDYQEAFRKTVYAVVSLLKSPPKQLCAGILDTSRFPECSEVRKLLWEFTRFAETGLPSGHLHAQSEWHPKLVLRMKHLVVRLKEKYGFEPHENPGLRLKKTGLPTRPLIDPKAEKSSVSPALRVETIHGVKGESLDAVLYLADREHVKAMVGGTRAELGRIGYVALTRARDLFWIGMEEQDATAYREALLAHKLLERRFEDQLELPIDARSVVGPS